MYLSIYISIIVGNQTFFSPFFLFLFLYLLFLFFCFCFFFTPFS